MPGTVQGASVANPYNNSIRKYMHFPDEENEGRVFEHLRNLSEII